jgi:hypothetical protein
MFKKRKRYDLDDLESRDPKTLTFDENVFLMMEPVERAARQQYAASQPPLLWARLWSLAMGIQVVAVFVGIIAIGVALVPAFEAFLQAFESVSFWVAVGCGAVIVAVQLFFRRTGAPGPWW